jgi:NAD(P)-dependent dehydrogenase (short-subunit alcohol dehydrogenase family)
MNKSRKRILLVGADGVIGRHVHAALKLQHEVICAGLEGADVKLDLSDAPTLVAALAKLGQLDAVISTAGRAKFVALADIPPASLDTSAYGLGLKDKLMGQVNLALAAREVLSPGGSITLTSDTTSTDPILGGSSLSMVNGALDHWVRAAAMEMRALRINVVSPSLVEGTPAGAIAAFPGFELVSGSKIAAAYIRCLESGLSGEVVRA